MIAPERIERLDKAMKMLLMWATIFNRSFWGVIIISFFVPQGPARFLSLFAWVLLGVVFLLTVAAGLYAHKIKKLEKR